MPDYSTEVHENPEVDPLINENGERIATEGGPEKEPMRKSVAGGLAASGALVLVWIVEALPWNVDMPTEVALAIAGLIGAAVAFYKQEWH